MKEIVFLVEGEAERYLLDAFLPRVLPEGIGFRVIPFQGKQDMEKRMALRIRGYINPQARFLILRDQDSHANCVALKNSLLERCIGTRREAHCLVRIACTELETFYLADLAAVSQALDIPGLERQQLKSKFRNPDSLGSPSIELRALTKNRYDKRSGSAQIGRYLALDNTRSASFRHFVIGIQRLCADLLAD
ncbi:MAG: DUF4276 family protein [Giesbergeria sp.]|nr:DUF4276 family protein [Giesbergeria sp.]